MSGRVKIKMADLGPALAALGPKIRMAILKGTREAAKTLLASIQRHAAEANIDDGPYRQGFRIVVAGEKLSVVNDLPYARLIEFGRRPGPVSAEGIRRLTIWVERKGMASGKEARSVAFAVATKIKREGFKPRYVVTKALKSAKGSMRAEIEAALARVTP